MKFTLRSYLLPAIAVFLGIGAIGHAEEALKGNTLENLITIPVAAGWIWVKHELPPGAPSLYICKKGESQTAITVQIFNRNASGEDIRKMAKGARTGFEKSAKDAGQEVTLGELAKAGGPTGDTWSFAGTMKGSDQPLLHTRLFVLAAPKVISISCISPDTKELESLSAVVEKSELVK